MAFVARLLLAFLVVLEALVLGVSAAADAPDAKGITLPDLYEASVLELQAGLDAGHFTSVDLIKVSLLTRVDLMIILK